MKSNDIISIESILDNLSDSSFKFVMKLITMSFVGGEYHFDDVSSMKKDMNVTSPMKFDELFQKKMIIRKDRQNCYLYRLSPEMENLFNISSAKIILKSEDVEISIDGVKKILYKRFKNDCDDQMIKLVYETIESLQDYYLSIDQEFKGKDFRAFLASMSLYEPHIVKESCSSYLENHSLRETKGWKYIIAMMKNMTAEWETSKKKRKFAKDGMTIVGGKETRQTSEQSSKVKIVQKESEASFALRVVQGEIENSRVYAKMLAGKEYKKLNDLWRIGYGLLSDKSRSIKYDWLDKQ